jgi:hypothetical protein
MNGFNKINCLYEFKTPNGFLPVGFEYKALPIIFSHINESSNLRKDTMIRTVNSHRFELIDNVLPFFNSLNFKTKGFNHKLISDITNDEIANDLNLLCIGSIHTQTILRYVENADFTDILSEKTIDLVKNNKNFKIVFIDEKEGGFHHTDLFFNNLYNLYNHIGLDNADQIIYLTSSASIKKEYQTFLKCTKLSSFMKATTIDFYILSDAGYNMDQYNEEMRKGNFPYLDRNIHYDIPNKDELSIIRNKYFLNLNRNSSRLHRPKLVLELIKNNLFSKGIVSLLKSDEFDEFCNRDENIEYKTLIAEKYPFIADYEDADFVSHMHNYFTKKDMWMTTYFSIVSETSADNNFTFITEKTVRPMIYYHPFIVWGNPHTLKRLKQLGFETFPEFFDESYDAIIDNDKRLQKIVENVQRLCSKSLDEIHSMYIKVIPKLEKNHKMLLTFYNDNVLYKKLIKAIR